jgi:hypothetical protein
MAVDSYNAGEVGSAEEDSTEEKPTSTSEYSHDFGDTVTSVYDKTDACKCYICGCFLLKLILYSGELRLGKFLLWLTKKGVMQKSFLLGPSGQARGATSSSLHQYFYYRT